MGVKMKLSIFIVLVAVLTGTTTRALAAVENGINWRIEAAKHIDKTYSETSTMINLFVALLSNQKYYDQIREELNGAMHNPRGQNCGLKFFAVSSCTIEGYRLSVNHCLAVGLGKPL